MSQATQQATRLQAAKWAMYQIKRLIVVSSLGAVWTCAALTAHAQNPAQNPDQTPGEKQALQQRVDHLEKELEAVKAELAAMSNAAKTSSTSADAARASADAKALTAATTAISSTTPAPTQAQSQSTPQPASVAPGTRPGSTIPSVSGVDPAAVYNLNLGATQPTTAEQSKHRFFERKPGRDLTFYTKTGEITFYGNLDVSVDTATKGTANFLSGGVGPVGNMGWLEDISTNLAYVGVRGTQMTGLKDTNFLFQLETSINISTAPGIHESNSQEQDTVDGTLFTRNSYIGLGRVKWGALLFGKTDPPYKQSTARMNPFNGMEGDYGVIMGNTGGDNRVEFGYRLDHSIWYTSPNLR